MHAVTLIPGDGIGPEVTLATKRVIKATGACIQWDEQEAGESRIQNDGTPLLFKELALSGFQDAGNYKGLKSNIGL